MKFKLIGDNIQVTEGIYEYLTKRLNSLNLPDDVTILEFRVGVEKTGQYIKFLSRTNNKDISITEEDENLYTAIDKLVTRVKRSFEKASSKRRTLIMKNNRSKKNNMIEGELESLYEDLPEIDKLL